MATRRPSPYEVLGLGPTATPEDVRRAYLERVRELHPDTGKEGASHERFVQLREAYDCLSDPVRRREYDRRLKPPTVRPPTRPWSGAPRPSLEELFEGEPWVSLSDIFAGSGFERLARRMAPAAPRLDLAVQVTPAQARGGTQIAVQIPATAACADCGSSGRTNLQNCPSCRGTGLFQGTRRIPVRLPPFNGPATTMRFSLGTGGAEELDLVLHVTVG
ncbi:MAG: DnaJ domain-containing protein [Candidatus Riflebacteria bacterium]|nr:DnaJ domain-containing protein [Candidatus Riflebacteria bacterium]